MKLTKLEFRTHVQQLIDDSTAKMWSAANLDILITLTLDELWAEIFEHSTYELTQVDELTAISPGKINLGLTGVGAGQLTQRFHRLQAVVRNATHYYRVDPRNILLEDDAIVVGYDYQYAILGNEIWLFPLTTTGDVEIRYSYKPEGYNDLADGDTVEWPDGHYSAATWECAGRALMKGNREQAGQFLALSEMARRRMIDAIGRKSIGPKQAFTTGSAQEMGGI